MCTPNSFKILKKVAGQDFKLKEKEPSTTAINYCKSVQIQRLSLDSYIVLPKLQRGKNLKVMEKFSNSGFPSSYKNRLVKDYKEYTLYINN